MPVYEFLCDTCGPFTRWREYRAAGDPLPCPTCQAVAKRLYSAPGLRTTSAAERTARLRNEQGAEPRLEKRSPGETAASPHQHHDHRGRPWMLGH